MKTLFIILSLITSAATAQVVKVTGVNCNTKSPLRNGSGIALQVNGGNFVVSSDHVTPANSSICYQVIDINAKTYNAELITSDWEHGLSLLHLPNEFHAQFRTDDFTKHFNSENFLSVSTVGFPATSSQLLRDTAHVVMTGSKRSLFVEEQELIEFIGPQIEFGMSGGALIDSTTGKIIGLLSHQRLAMHPGQATALISAENTSLSNHGLAIPANRILIWLNRQLQGRASLYTTYANNHVIAAGMSLRQSYTPSQILMPKAAKGGDGVGVGGDGDSGSSVRVEIELQNLDVLKSNLHLRPEFSWFNTIAPILLKTKKIETSSFIYMNEENSQIEIIGIKSVSHFISALRTGRAIPIIESKETQSVANLTLPQLTSDADPELKNLLALIEKLTGLKQQYGQLFIAPRFKQSLTNHPGWKSFFEYDFESAVKLKTFCESI